MAVSSSHVRADDRRAELTATNAGPVVADATPGEKLRSAWSAPPLWEKRVLELAPSWEDLAPPYRWAGERLRIFLLTWDPFEWQPERPAAFATSTSRTDDIGLVFYLPLWQARALTGGDAAALPEVLGPLAESILGVGGEQQAAIVDGVYAAGVHSGALPRLLSRVPTAPTLPPPRLTVVGEGWQPIQFDVLEDLGQDIFGPADLDRSPVRFREPGEKRDGCPGCEGRAVNFPDGLKDTQDTICGAHRAEALRITTARLEAAKASNPAGWESLLDAGNRLLEPHLPDGLGPRLVAAAGLQAPTAEELAAHAKLVVTAAGLMEGLPDPKTALGGRLVPVRRWLEGLPAALEAAGLTEESARAAVAAEELLTGPEAVGAHAAAVAQAAAGEAMAPKAQPFRREARIGRNAQCPCGSGKKYKFCHGH